MDCIRSLSVLLVEANLIGPVTSEAFEKVEAPFKENLKGVLVEFDVDRGS